MNDKKIIDAVSKLSMPILEERDLELVDIEFKRERSGWILRFFVEKKGGRVSLDECAEASQEIGVILEVEDIIPFAYHLEVSSPGLNRQLKKDKDFATFTGRLVRILTKFPVENLTDFRGTLLGIEGDKVRVNGGGKIWEIPLSGIARANLDF